MAEEEILVGLYKQAPSIIIFYVLFLRPFFNKLIQGQRETRDYVGRLAVAIENVSRDIKKILEESREEEKEDEVLSNGNGNGTGKHRLPPNN